MLKKYFNIMSLSTDDLVSKHSFAVFIAYTGIILSYGLLLGKYVSAWPLAFFAIAHQSMALFITKKIDQIPHTLSLLISLLIMALAGFFHFQFAVLIFTVIFLPSFLKYIWDEGRKFKWGHTLLILVTTSIFSMGSFNRIFDNNYRVPSALVNPASLNLTSMDTFFHASVANMITNFSTISTGVDGLTPLYYHVFSHGLYSGLASFLNISNLEFYSLYAGIFIVPLLWIFLLSFAFSLNKNVFSIKFIVFFFAGFYLFNYISHPDLPRSPVMWGSELVSDSYTISLILLICLMDYLLAFDPLKKPVHFIVLFFLIAFTSHAKISSGTTAIAIANLFIFARLLSQINLKNTLLFSFFGALTLAFIYMMVSVNAGTPVERVPYHFWDTYVSSKELKRMETYYNYLWVALLLLLVIFNKERIKKSLLLQLSVVLLVVFAINEIPGLLLALPGGSAYYFSNIFKQIVFPVFFVLALGIGYYRVIKYAFGIICVAAYTLCMKHSHLLAFYKAEAKPTVQEQEVFEMFKTLKSFPHKYVYISKANPVWELGTICNKIPFLGPALTGKIFINNIDENCDYNSYGFADITNVPLILKEEGSDVVCAKFYKATTERNAEIVMVKDDSQIEVIPCL